MALCLKRSKAGMRRVQREMGVAHTFSDDVQRVLPAYSWPGNVREPEDAIEGLRAELWPGDSSLALWAAVRIDPCG